ncbi:hypothetical protein KIH75_09555 [Bifidobacterium sp. 64T4]|uniref:carbohydrate binding domain-containing protein n=1 Tax=Bifidobacterium pongonis TaxID=2834432 RepID=UPI001C5A57A6|nr:carbohydrate binding domain-containing protein [Bifidobacterium pongonis]MBW3095566.1 hypothetical protein [Bifidobacterium pongonis]
MSGIMGGAMCAGRIVSGACLGGKRIGIVHAGQLICPSGKNLVVYPLGARKDGLMQCELMSDGGLQVTLKAGLKQWNGLGVTVGLADIGLSPGDTVLLSSRYGDVVPPNCSFNIKFRRSGGVVVYDSGVWSANGQLKVTVPAAAEKVLFTVFRSVATTEDCEMILHPMLEKGSAATVWEPPENAGGGQGLDATSPAQDLIVNGGFESGDLTGWTVTGYAIVVDRHASTVNKPHSGIRWLVVTRDGTDVLQRVEVTPEASLRLSFWRAEGGVDSIRVGTVAVKSDDGRVIASLDLPVPPDTAWHAWTLDFTVPSDVDAVAITFASRSWMRLDDVSLIRIA